MRGPIAWFVIASATVGACASGGAAIPTGVGSLHAAVTRKVSYGFEHSEFVIANGTTTYAGPRSRMYSFDSITKTVTALILARLAESGKPTLSTPIGSVLSAGRNGDITFEQLASHSAGLPKLAANFDSWPGFDSANPYAGFTAPMAESALRDVTRSGSPTYSNFGFQLLGLALERATGRTLDDLASDLVFIPAGMRTAHLPQTPHQLPSGKAAGHDVPAWDQQLGGAGGAMGTIEDLAAYGAMMLDPPQALRSAVDTAVTVRSTVDGNRTGLAWVTTNGLTWHNGASRGYRALIVLDRAHHRAAGYLAATGDLGDKVEPAVFALVRGSRQ
jgi:CubicO group peptidase (beta-lactamase class C family)